MPDSSSPCGRLRVVTKSYKNQLNQSYSNTLIQVKVGCQIFPETLQAEKEMMSQLPSKNGLIMFKTENGLIVFINS